MSLPASSSRRRPVLTSMSSLAAVGLLLAGCSSTTAPASSVRSGSDDVAFSGCDKVACTGTLAGAKYQITLPSKWNGTLLLYSHGYRQAKPAPPDFAPVDTEGQVAGTREETSQLVAQGYALAGSAYATNGWAVADGVRAGEQLHDLFVQKVGKPDRTYVWGDSLGGLITATLAEKHPEWVDGAAPMCGVLGGSTLNLDLALDLAYVVKTLVYPQLKLTGYSSYDDAVRNFQGAYAAILAATRNIQGGVPRLLLGAALTDGPTQTERFDGSTPTAKVSAIVESLVTGLGYGTFDRWEIEQRVGGNPSGNAGVDYGTRVSAPERALIETVSKGSTDRLLAQLAAGPRVTPDGAARAAFDKLGNPTGDIVVPTITLHTTADPLVLVQNETVYRQRVLASKNRSADLVQLYTAPPATYSAPAPYGAGHCNFTAAERLGMVTLLDGWVRKGVYPAAAAVEAAFRGDHGLALGYTPGPWPAAG